jgi:hypothetical protein
VPSKRKQDVPPAGLERLRTPAPRPHLAVLQSTTDGATPPGIGRVSLVRLADLWLEHQPREIVPEEQLQRLIATDQARPAALLEALRWAAAADSY